MECEDVSFNFIIPKRVKGKKIYYKKNVKCDEETKNLVRSVEVEMRETY